MSHQSRHFRLVPLLVALVVPLATGCDLIRGLTGAYDEPIDLDVDLASPGIPVDVTTQVTAFEGSMCAGDEDGETCVVLKAIDRTDDDDVEDPPAIPDEFQNEITVEDDDGNEVPDPECIEAGTPPDQCEAWVVNAEEFLAESGIFDAIDFAQVVPIDLTEEVQVTSPDAVQDVRITDVGLDWIDNTLTFDTVDLDLYMSLEFFEEGDAKELIAEGTVTKIGTIDRQLALTSGVTPINFSDAESEALFNDGLKQLKFTVVVAAPEGTQFTLADGEAAGTKLKPQGEVEISLVATLVYTVTPSELVGEAADAYNESGGVESWF